MPPMNAIELLQDSKLLEILAEEWADAKANLATGLLSKNWLTHQASYVTDMWTLLLPLLLAFGKLNTFQLD